MNTTKKRILYFLYTLAALGFFLYHLFPSEEIKKYIAFKISRSKPGYAMDIEQVKPAFPPGIVLHSADILNENQLMAQVEEVKITPSLLSLLGSEPEFLFKAAAFEGKIKGRARLKKNNENPSPDPEVSVEADMEGIQIKKIEAVQNLSEYKTSGILSGKINYSGNGTSGIGSADINISNCTVELTKPFFNINQLMFTDINSKISLKDLNLHIEECIIKGNQAGGSISGIINLRNPSENSILNISGTVRPHPSLIAKMGSMASLLFQKKQGGDFPFKISGTIGNPKFSLK